MKTDVLNSSALIRVIRGKCLGWAESGPFEPLIHTNRPLIRATVYRLVSISEALVVEAPLGQLRWRAENAWFESQTPSLGFAAIPLATDFTDKL